MPQLWKLASAAQSRFAGRPVARSDNSRAPWLRSGFRLRANARRAPQLRCDSSVRARDGGDLLKVAKDVAVAVDVRLKNFPVVDAAPARRTGVSQDEARFDLVGRNRQPFATDAVGGQMNGADAAVERGIVILTAGGHMNQLRFDILRQLAQLFFIELAAGEAGEGSGGRDHERRRARDAGAGGRLGIGLEG